MADEGNSTGSNVVWAIALVIIVAIIAALIYSGGFGMFGRGDKKVDINVTAPAPESHYIQFRPGRSCAGPLPFP